MSCVIRVMEQLVQGSAQSKAANPWGSRSLLLGGWGCVPPRVGTWKVLPSPLGLLAGILEPPVRARAGGAGGGRAESRGWLQPPAPPADALGVPHQLGPCTGTGWECLVPILAARSASNPPTTARDEFLGWFPPRGLDAGCFLRNTLFPAFLGRAAWLAVPLPAKPSWSLLPHGSGGLFVLGRAPSGVGGSAGGSRLVLWLELGREQLLPALGRRRRRAAGPGMGRKDRERRRGGARSRHHSRDITRGAALPANKTRSDSWDRV